MLTESAGRAVTARPARLRGPEVDQPTCSPSRFPAPREVPKNPTPTQEVSVEQDTLEDLVRVTFGSGESTGRNTQFAPF